MNDLEKDKIRYNSMLNFFREDVRIICETNPLFSSDYRQSYLIEIDRRQFDNMKALLKASEELKAKYGDKIDEIRADTKERKECPGSHVGERCAYCLWPNSKGDGE